jgi:hypothetical protein
MRGRLQERQKAIKMPENGNYVSREQARRGDEVSVAVDLGRRGLCQLITLSMVQRWLLHVADPPLQAFDLGQHGNCHSLDFL